jgi:aminopeptidase N
MSSERSTGPEGTADPYVPGHGDLRYAVTDYDLHLDYGIATNHLSSRTTLAVRLLTATDVIELDLSSNLKVLGLVARGGADLKVKRHSHRGSKLTVRFAETVPADTTLTLTIATKGNPRPMRGPDGLAGWEELEDGVIVASQPHGAPSWFPCNDRAADKATYRFTITCDTAYAVIANGCLTGKRKVGQRTAWTYVQDEPMAPYLATLQIGRYEVRDLATGTTAIPVRLAGPPALRAQLAKAFADQVQMVEAMQEWFGPYPFAAGYTAVVTADDLEIPLESQTLSTFGANLANRTWEAQRLIAHELAHQWWGNSVTAAHWHDIWLHEGFACYAEWLWSPLAGLESTDARARHHWTRLAALPQDLVLTAPGARDMFDDRVYKRGALTLHALRLEVGDDTFFAILREWGAGHRHGVVSTTDFERLVADVAGRPLTSVFDAWLRSPQLPHLV